MAVKLLPFWMQAPTAHLQFIKAVVHPDVLESSAAQSNSSALGQYLGLIHGKASTGPGNPYPFVAAGDGLMRPKAVFRGLTRPIGNSSTGNHVYCYCVNPDKTYRLDLDHFTKNLGKSESEHLLLIAEPAPQDSVFVAFVLIGTAVVDAIRDRVHDPVADVQAVVIGWEWTLGMPDDSGLPFDHSHRYAERTR